MGLPGQSTFLSGKFSNSPNSTKVFVRWALCPPFDQTLLKFAGDLLDSEDDLRQRDVIAARLQAHWKLKISEYFIKIMEKINHKT